MAQIVDSGGAEYKNGNDKITIFINFIYKFGVPAVLALGLVYFLAQRVDGSLSSLEHTLQTHQIDSAKDIEIHSSIRNSIETQTQVLQSICVNTARTSGDRINCFKTQ